MYIQGRLDRKVPAAFGSWQQVLFRQTQVPGNAKKYNRWRLHRVNGLALLTNCDIINNIVNKTK